ncbi:MAG TPA: AAA family ATPase, partial [Actinomycetales bacterium]|nr:AAA family ATPase [Actinomycetales bacterium]
MLIGRSSEWQVIERLLAGARLGRSGVLVVRGEAGIGKSALLEESASRAEGMRLLQATGSEAERDVPFGGLLQVLRPALSLIDRLPGPQEEALGSALALRPASSGDRFAVGAAVLTLLCRFAEEAPVLVLIDEAAQLDRPSAEALTFAARRLFADPVAVLAAARSNESDAFTEAGLPSLDLEGLDPSSTGELISRSRNRDVPWALVERLHRATGGNPLALLELAGEPDDLDHRPGDAPVPVSDALARAFAVRASRLDQPVRTLLLLTAATDGDLGVVARAADTLSLDLTRLVDAERAGLVRVGSGRVGFRHPLVRSAVYSGAAADERRAAHRALAGAVGDDSDRRAWHLSEAALGPDEEAASALEGAGDGARARAAYSVAAGAYERSAALTSDVGRRAGRLIDAGQAAWLAGQGDRGLALLDAATQLAPPLPLRRRAAELRGAVQARGGSPVVARDLLIATAEEAAGDAPDVAIVHLADAVLACFYAGDARTALALAERIESLLGRVVTARARVLGTMAAGIGRVLAGEGGAEQVREAVAELGSSEGLAAEPERRAWLMLGPLWLRESDAGRDLVQRVVTDARERSAVGVLPWLLYLVAKYDATTDRWAEAEVGYTESIRLATETGQTTDLAAALAGLAWLEARQGRGDSCAEHAAEAERVCAAHDLHLFRVWSLFALAELELGRGETEAALGHLERLERLLDEIGLLDVDLSPAPELADALMRLGRVDEARAAADRLRP